MSRFTTLLAICAVAASGFGQSSDAYLKLRAKSHIVQAVGSRALDRIQGTQVVELQGTVKGSFQTGSTVSLMFELLDGDNRVVDATRVPDWLLGNEVPVRLLVQVAHSAVSSPKLNLLAAAPEKDVHAVELAYWKKEAGRRRTAPARSRGSNSIYGPIGKSLSSRHSSRPHREWVLPASDVTPIYAKFIRSRNPHLSLAKSHEIAQSLVGFSLHYGVDARLIVAMVMVESDFDPNSTSNTGAMGLGQLMPGTARWMGVNDAYDTNDNLYGMVKLVRTHLWQYRAQTGEDFSALCLALAAYNSGEGAVRRHGGIPPYRATQAYVRRVIQIYEHLCGYS